MEAQSAKLFLSAVSIFEIEDGIAKAKREGATRKAADFATWFMQVLDFYADRILPMDAAIASIAGSFSDIARGQGKAPGMADIIIAATAKHHGLIVLTRNVRHFDGLGVEVIDPFLKLP